MMTNQGLLCYITWAGIYKNISLPKAAASGINNFKNCKLKPQNSSGGTASIIIFAQESPTNTIPENRFMENGGWNNILCK